jgi:hypothetical protein
MESDTFHFFRVSTPSFRKTRPNFVDKAHHSSTHFSICQAPCYPVSTLLSCFLCRDKHDFLNTHANLILFIRNAAKNSHRGNITSLLKTTAICISVCLTVPMIFFSSLVRISIRQHVQSLFSGSNNCQVTHAGLDELLL